MVDDKTVEIDARGFFRDLGITDEADLDALRILMCGDEGGMRDLGSLERLRDLVLHGCFRTESQLRRALFDAYGQKVYADSCAPGVDALVARRKYGVVPTVETAQKYCPGWSDFSFRLEYYLGAQVPEWFFPALATLARERNDSHGYWDGLFRALTAWQMGGDPLDLAFRDLMNLLKEAHPYLSKVSEEATGKWIIVYRSEDEPDDSDYIGH